MAEIGVIVLLSLAPFAWRKAVGGDHIPAADSWAYERIFATFHEQGTIRLVGWNDINLLGMLPVAEVWVAIFGYGRDQLHLLGSFMAAVALLGFNNLLSSLGVVQRVPALVLIGTFSGFVGVAGTFQSDAFALTGAIWAIALAVRLYVRREPRPAKRRVRWLDNEITVATVAAVAAAYAFSVRQQAVAAGIGALLVCWNCRSRQPAAWKAFGITYVVLVAPFYLWRSGLANGGSVEIGLHPRSILAALQWNTVSLGLLLAPAVTWLALRFRRRTAELSLLVLLGGALLVAGHTSRMRAPQERGVMTEVWRHLGTPASTIPLLALFSFAASGWVWACREMLRERAASTTSNASALMARVMLICLAIELFVAFTSTYFSRYSLLSGMVALSWLFLRPIRQRALAIGLVALMCGLSHWELDKTVAANGATERAGEIAACLGIPPERLDAGFFWDGMHYEGIAAAQGGDHPGDGLPDSIDRAYYPEMQRDAVLVDRPAPYSDDQLQIGPLASSGLLPWNSKQFWLVVRRAAIPATGVKACTGADS